MSVSVAFSSVPDPGAFSYDSDNPTYYTEWLSHSIHALLYNLGGAGGKMFLEGTDPDVQASDSGTFSAALVTWAVNNIDTISSYLNDDGSGSPPAIPDPPSLPATIGGAVKVFAGGKLKILLEVLPTVLECYGKWESARKERALERMLDSALNRSSYFGLVKSAYLEEISDALKNGDGDKLADILSDKKRLYVFLKAAIESDYTISDFDAELWDESVLAALP